MKKLTLLSLILVFCIILCSCGKTETETKTQAQTTSNQVQSENSDCFPSVTDSMEYTLYQNIFYNEQGDTYLGESITKTGTFSIIYDEFSNKTRYYCWGYYDNTKCCDWQWEFVPTDINSLPTVGSLIEMTGTFSKSDEALDGYWFTDATVTVKQAFKGPDCDVDMTSMSATLERVQIQNMQYASDKFEGKTVAIYGRVKTDYSVQHPYYDDTWEQAVTTADNSQLPAIGTYVTVQGTFSNTNIINAEINQTDNY